MGGAGGVEAVAERGGVTPPTSGETAGPEVPPLPYDQGRNEQMYSQRPEETAMVKPLLAGTSK